MDHSDAGHHDDHMEASNDGDDFKIRGATIRSQNHRKQKLHIDGDTCSICLEPISERAVAVPCNHLTFDFLCLVSWLQERSSCPLCNSTVTAVEYDFRGPDDYKSYRLPRSKPEAWNESAVENARRRRGRDFIRRRSNRVESNQASEDPALQSRRDVYRHKLYSLHVGANQLSGYHDFTMQDFSRSEELQRRARMFLRRELHVFSFLGTDSAPRGGNPEFLLEYIVAILKTNELKGASGHAENLITDYLGRGNAKLLLHELQAWLRSPFKSLRDWDQHVQYMRQPSESNKNNA